MLKKLVSLFAAVLLFSTQLSVLAANESAPTPDKLAPSQEYLEYISDPDAWGDRLIPAYFNIRDLGGEDTGKSDGYIAPPKLPSAYSSVSAGYTTPVKNQGSDGTCAYFSTMGSLEAFMKKTTGTTYDFSEQHAKLITASQYSGSDTKNIYGFDREPNGGAHFVYILPHLNIGKGPVYESQMPYINGNEFGTKAQVESLASDFRLADAYFIEGYGKGATEAQENEWISRVKDLVYQYGAVSISLDMQTSYMKNYEYMYYFGEEKDHNHAVVVVGWDDNISASKFNAKSTIPGKNGAFIIRNSWGGDYHGDGYFYYSYDSVGIAKQDAMVITDVNSMADKKVNTYTEHGMTSAVGYTGYSSPVYYGNKFYLAPGEYVNLDEVTFFVNKENMDYEVYLSPTGKTNTSSLQKIASGTSTLTGYYTEEIDNIVLGGENATTYFVAVKVYPRTTGVYSIPIEGSNYSTVNNVSSYIKYIENGECFVVADTTENRNMIAAKGLSVTSVSSPSYYALDGYGFSNPTDYNVVVSTVTSPVDMSVAATGIDLYKEGVKVSNGGSTTLKCDDFSTDEYVNFSAQVLPDDVTDGSYTISCNNSAVSQKVGENIRIYPARATADCTAVITATSNDGGFTARYTVNIDYTEVVAATGISIYKDGVQVANNGSTTLRCDDFSAGEYVTFSARVLPDNVTDGDYTIFCSNFAVSEKVGPNIRIYPSEATADTAAVITATSSDGGFVARYTVNIDFTEPPRTDAYVFSIGNSTAYWNLYDYSFEIDQACTIVDGVAYVPFRVIAQAAGAKSIDYNSSAGTIVITNSYDMTFNLTMDTRSCTYVYNGITFGANLNAPPTYINGACCLPIRDVSNITFANVNYTQDSSGTGYVVVSKESVSSEETDEVIENYRHCVA
ncbi:MAG: hypothetical protein IJL87_03210 [Clostridia bacterium]|nr:hypothetical protein [Clostridia bacterium]